MQLSTTLIKVSIIKIKFRLIFYTNILESIIKFTNFIVVKITTRVIKISKIVFEFFIFYIFFLFFLVSISRKLKKSYKSSNIISS